MAAVDLWGYRSGRREIRKVKISNTPVTGGIKVGDIMEEDGAGSQYFTQAGAGDIPRCVALQPVAEADIPTNDGDVEILAEFSLDAVFEYPADTGTVTDALVGKTMDLGGAQSIDIDASADDCVRCVKVNTTKNSLFVKLAFDQGLAGVA